MDDKEEKEETRVSDSLIEQEFVIKVGDHSYLYEFDRGQLYTTDRVSNAWSTCDKEEIKAMLYIAKAHKGDREISVVKRTTKIEIVKEVK